MSEKRACPECDGAIDASTYNCAECGKQVMVCKDCSRIYASCPCGNCEEGAYFQEAEE